MRKLMIALAAVAMFGAVPQAQADHGGTLPAGCTDRTAGPCEFTQSAPLPCTVACSYWDAGGAAGYDECNPFPEGSYDMTKIEIFGTAPVQIEAQSPIDYDSFICSNTPVKVLIQTMANNVGDPCEGVAGNNQVAIGCLETGSITLDALEAEQGAGNPYFWLISYNWSDNGQLPVKMSGPARIDNDHYQAAGLPI